MFSQAVPTPSDTEVIDPNQPRRHAAYRDDRRPCCLGQAEL